MLQGLLISPEDGLLLLRFSFNDRLFLDFRLRQSLFKGSKQSLQDFTLHLAHQTINNFISINLLRFQASQFFGQNLLKSLFVDTTSTCNFFNDSINDSTFLFSIING